MYSPTKDNNNEVRMGNNKKIYVIKGTRKIKKTTHSSLDSKSFVSKSLDSK
jgi:hypothetical protein